MNEIKNIEEKSLQIAYFISRRKGGVSKFSLKNIHRQWCQWWGNDFCVEGRKLKVFHDEIVLSSAAIKRGERQPNYCDYCTKVLKNAQNMMINEYHTELSGRENSDIFKDKLLECRRKHGKALRKRLKKYGLNKRYYITHNSYTRYVCKLGRYILHDRAESKDKYRYIGSYDDMCCYIVENLITENK